MDNMERLDQAEIWLAESKRAGAINEIIGVCRAQQAQIVNLQAALAVQRRYSYLLLESTPDA